MNDTIKSAVTLRKLELAVLGIGLLIALVAIGLGSQGAFRANMAWTHGTERLMAILLTLVSLLIVGAVAVAPYALLAILGKRIASDGKAGFNQIVGFVLSCLVTAASAYLYVDALHTVSHDRSSTAGLVFVAVPVFLCLAGGAAYGVLVLLHSRGQRRNGA